MTDEVNSPAVAVRLQRPVGRLAPEREGQAFKLDAALIRGAALDNDAMYEARAEASCSMGVGCGTAGACYAERNGRPELCGRVGLSIK